MTLKHGICPDERRKKLKKLLKQNKYIRGCEAHDGISAIIVNEAKVNDKKFHFIWDSSLCSSTCKGYPDASLLGFDARLNITRQILDVTNLPLVFDGDTGGDVTNFEYMIRRLEMLGVSAVIIEDKVFPKRNSLADGTIQHQENMGVFAEKIRRGKKILLTKDFMIIARIESMIAGKCVKEALLRAKMYLEAGVDAIMIHSKKENPKEILEFAKQYKKLRFNKPLFCVPTTYNSITEKELA